MKQIVTLFFLLSVALGSGFSQTVVYGENVQKREIGPFHAIETSSGIEVLITRSNQEELAVSVGNKEYLDEVKTVVTGGVLKISRNIDWKFWNKWKNWKVKVYVSYKELESIKANSGGSIHGTDVNLTALNVRMNSGGTVNLSGSVGSLDIEANSGAQFRSYGLTTTTCEAEVSSGGGIQVTVSKEISARASSGGYIRFKGDGLIRDINVNSGGSVKRQN